MKLHFDDITARPSYFTVKENSWHAEGDGCSFSGTANITASKLDGERVSLKGRFDGVLTAPCSRCGKKVSRKAENSFAYLVTTKPETIPELPEIECSDDDVNTLYLDTPVIDIAEIVQEQLYLEVPLQILCDGNCKGICPGCGADLNSETCTCVKDNSNSPFAVLGNLKKKTN
ncbi:DUF177 domain-containing protein [Desulforhopalus singaporensis]|uniref:DUF177 domain-containing protein n=1 Tax=Desulforhopalus singaporensis TaxID=91360 RepID=A0A1H0MM82_9BACT|nr:DUF177 domain-containing protein [Desulforhopalus singaporensis]SDO81396.1 uncharacterized protein SAMN05660330_01104 [Desulforhopalus singaporensis]